MDITLDKIVRVWQKSLLLASLFPSRPAEVRDRLANMLEVRADLRRAKCHVYRPVPWDELLASLGRVVGAHDIRSHLQEAALARIEEVVANGIDRLPSDAPFMLSHNADFALARLCYCVCRATRPSAVVETGVAYGVTSAFILQALRVNEGGELHSIDLPPLGYQVDRFEGVLVPENLRSRWRLHRGVSSRILPDLLPRLGRVDLFVHDSLHTYRNMRLEFATAEPFLAPGGVVIADDVEGNTAFAEWARRACVGYSATTKEPGKASLLGVGVLSDAHPSSS